MANNINPDINTSSKPDQKSPPKPATGLRHAILAVTTTVITLTTSTQLPAIALAQVIPPTRQPSSLEVITKEVVQAESLQLLWNKEINPENTGKAIYLAPGNPNSVYTIEQSTDGVQRIVAHTENTVSEQSRGEEYKIKTSPFDGIKYTVRTIKDWVTGKVRTLWGPEGSNLLYFVGYNIGNNHINPGLSFATEEGQSPNTYLGASQAVTYLADISEPGSGHIDNQTTISLKDESSTAVMNLLQDLDSQGVFKKIIQDNPDLLNIKAKVLAHIRQNPEIDPDIVDQIDVSIADLTVVDGSVLVIPTNESFFWNANRIPDMPNPTELVAGTRSIDGEKLPMVGAILNGRAVVKTAKEIRDNLVTDWDYTVLLDPLTSTGSTSENLDNKTLSPRQIADTIDSRNPDAEKDSKVSISNMGNWIQAVHIRQVNGNDRVNFNSITKRDGMWVGHHEELFSGEILDTKIVSTDRSDDKNSFAIAAIKVEDNTASIVGIAENKEGRRISIDDIRTIGDPSNVRVDVAVSSDGNFIFISVLDEDGKRIRVFKLQIDESENYLPGILRMGGTIVETNASGQIGTIVEVR